jgi:hypothetical protein
MKQPPQKGEIVIYRTEDGETALDVTLEEQTVWLSLNQMVTLFQRDKSVVSRHLNNIFKARELRRDSVVAFFATTASDGKTYQVEYFNLDAIIGVGYRVNSKRGTQFRIWATSVLREHLVRGYTVNEKRLKELRQTVQLIAEVAGRHPLTSDEAAAVLFVVRDYTFALDLLDDYEHIDFAWVSEATLRRSPSDLTPAPIRFLPLVEMTTSWSAVISRSAATRNPTPALVRFLPSVEMTLPVLVRFLPLVEMTMSLWNNGDGLRAWTRWNHDVVTQLLCVPAHKLE